MITVLFLLALFTCETTQKKEIVPVDNSTIRGFTQFQVYQGAPLLGYVSTGNDVFNYSVWEGITKSNPIKQSMRIEYNNETSGHFRGILKNVINIDSALKDDRKIELILINPTEIILANPYPALQFENNAELLSKSFIGSMLYADKIHLSIKTKDDVLLSGELSSKYLYSSASVKFQKDSSQNSTFTSEKAYIGYKLSTPPSNTSSLKPFQFDYQFLYNERGTKGWKQINERAIVKSNDSLKIQLLANYPCYVYLFNIDAKGNVAVLFPDAGVGYDNPLESNKKYEFPKATNIGYALDNNRGVEEFFFMVFRADSQDIKNVVELVRQGKIKGDEFKNTSVVQKTETIRSKGIGGYNQVLVSENETTPGFDFKTKRIKGMPADFKETFLLDHR